MITSAMRAAIRPYSMAVAPDSSRTKREIRFMEASNFHPRNGPAGAAFTATARHESDHNRERLNARLIAHSTHKQRCPGAEQNRRYAQVARDDVLTKFTI